jgi:hypothetical protein
MRIMVLTLAVLVAGTAPAAERWREYVYPTFKFAINFPLAPNIGDVDYENADGSTVRARSYSLEQPEARYSILVADFSHSRLDEFAVLDHAVSLLADGATIKLDVRCRFDLIYTCREMSFVGRDGTHSAATFIFYARRLYRAQGTILPANSNPLSAESIRFTHSLRFVNFNSQFAPQ